MTRPSGGNGRWYGLVGVAIASVLVAAIVGLRSRSASFPNSNQSASAQAVADRTQVTARQPASATPPPPADQRDRLRPEDIERIKQAGWKFVDAPPPDTQLVALDVLNQLAEREAEVQVQLSSVSHVGAELDRARQIALKAPSEKTRNLAIEAIGRSPDPRNQQVLIQLYGDLESPADRERVLTYVRPGKLGDAASDFLFDVMSDSSVTDASRTRASVALISAAIREAGRVPEQPDPALLSRVPEDWRPKFREIYASFGSGGH